jgi:type I restriction enzyme S subunit
MIKQRLPNDWAIISFNFKTGDNAPQDKKYFLNGTYPFIRMQHTNNLKKNKYPKNKDYLNDLAIKENNLTLFKKGSIILAKSGASIKSERKALLEEDSYVVNHFAIIEPENWFDYSYVYYYFYNFKLSSLLSETTTPSINLSTYNKLKIPLPPLKEQKKIKTTERIKKGLMDKLFYREKLVAINKLFQVINGKTPSTRNEKYWTNSEINWFTPVDLKEDSLFLKNSLRKISKIALNETSIKLLPKKTIIFSCRAPVGLVAVMEEEGSFNQGCKGLIPLEKENINPYYYAYYISLNKQQLINKAGQSTFKEISTTLFETFEVPKLSIEKQNKTVRILSSIDELINYEKNEKERLGRVKQGLMDNLLTGKVMVKI